MAVLRLDLVEEVAWCNGNQGMEMMDITNQLLDKANALNEETLVINISSLSI